MIAAKRLTGYRTDGAPILAVLYRTGKRKSFRRGGQAVKPAEMTLPCIFRALDTLQKGDVWIEDMDRPAIKPNVLRRIGP